MAEVDIFMNPHHFQGLRPPDILMTAASTGEWKTPPQVRGRKLKYKRPAPGVVTTCKLCGIESPPHASFHVHQRPYGQEKPFACNLCATSFGRKPYLDVHLRTHTGERPYECSQCHKRFTQKSSLNTHMKVHSGERPYSCEVCHKSFALKSYVAAHRWSHVSKEELGCVACGVTFTSKSLLMAHMRTHTTIRPLEHSCNICGRRFLRSGHLARHSAHAHSVLEVTPTIQGTNILHSTNSPQEEEECTDYDPTCQNFQIDTRSEHKAFGLFVAASLNNLKKWDALNAQHEINGILLKYRLSDVSSTNSTPCQTPVRRRCNSCDGSNPSPANAAYVDVDAADVVEDIGSSLFSSNKTFTSDAHLVDRPVDL